MEEIFLKDITAGTAFDKTLSFDGKSILLEAGMALDDEDVEILQRWKVKNLVLVDELSEDDVSDADVFSRFTSEKPLFTKVIDNTMREINHFFEDVRKRGMGQFNPVTKVCPDLLSILKRNKNFMLLIMSIRNADLNKLEEQAFMTAVLSLIIGIQVKLNDEQLQKLFECAVVANIGMLRFEPFYKRPVQPKPQELQAIMQHTLIGYKVLTDKCKLDKIHAACALNHHENIDGTGYPRKIRGDKIHLFTKIISVCQAYTEAIAIRPWAPPVTSSTAIKKIISDSKKKYEGIIVNCLVANLSMYPVGAVVQLRDNSIGVVIGSKLDLPLRPVIRLVIDQDGQIMDEGQIVDLASDNTVFISQQVEDQDLVTRIYENI